MRKYELEEVFNEAAYPEVTFVSPRDYPHIRSSFKTKGKHVTVSGPSGTGKTTLVRRLLHDLGIPTNDVLWLNGRRYSEFESCFHVLGQELHVEPSYDELTPLLQLVQFVVVDDFHHLKAGARLELAKTLKLWHENQVRFVIIGIGTSSEELYGTDPELGIRNDPFEMTIQDEAFTRELIQLGARALNIAFSARLTSDIVTASNGVPSIIQAICKSCCIEVGIDRTVSDPRGLVDVDLRDLRESVLRIFHAKYLDKVVGLAKGKRQARSVHNTYFDIIATIASETRSDIPIELLYRKIVGAIADSKQRSQKATSFYNCLKNLSDVIKEQGLDDTILYSSGGKTVSIEDPSFRFYLNLLDIGDVKSRIHLRSDEYPYDVAVSFAGDVRPRVEEFVRALQDRGLSVFYDFDQQAQLWGQDLRRRLSDIYSNEALYMAVFLSESYPEKDWPDFELAIGRETAGKRTKEYLLPIILDDVNVVGVRSTVGYVDLREVSVEQAADLLVEKIQQQSTK